MLFYLSMQNCIAHIKQTLGQHYSASEINGFIRIIFENICGYSLTDLILHKNNILSDSLRKQIDKIVERIDQNEPIQYIQGRARFLGRDFHVAPGVLIPRPETEELAEQIIDQAPAGARILDIGTGSGCIAISLALSVPKAQVTAWDISPEALRIARDNARMMNANVHFVACDVLTVQPDANERYDIIVSNPPYITEHERETMEPNVLEWEPAQALFVPDNDPLRFYRRIANLGRQLLAPNGQLYFEINQAYGEDTARMLREYGYTSIQIGKDLSGNDRFAKCQRV